MQLQLGLIPYHKSSRLYIDLIQDKSGRFIGSTEGYDGQKILVFYNTFKPDDHTEKNEVGRIIFPNFRLAYEFIKANNIKNFNLEQGCYKQEIKQYEKEIKRERG